MLPERSGKTETITRLRHQPDAVITGGRVGRPAAVEVVSRRADGVRNEENVGKTVCSVTTAGITACDLQGVRLAASHRPSDEDIAALLGN